MKKDLTLGITGSNSIPKYGVMIDLETLGVGVSPVITQVAATLFNITTGERIGASFNKFINIRTAVDVGLDLCPDTMKFWLTKVESTVFDDVVVKAMESKDTLGNVLHAFMMWVEEARTHITTQSDFVKGDEYLPLWGNGVYSDNKWLEAAYEAADKKSKHIKLSMPFNYREHFDMRTYVKMACATTRSNLYLEFKNTNPIDTKRQHEALYDVQRQIALVHFVYQVLED